MPNRMVMIYILYLPVAKLDAMVVNLDVKSEKVPHFRVKKCHFLPKIWHIFDENLKVCNDNLKDCDEKVKEFCLIRTLSHNRRVQALYQELLF